MKRLIKIGFVVSIWSFFMSGSCLCKFIVVKNSLKVTSPENLKGTYECAIDNSTIPSCGGTLSGVVVYPEVNRKACKSFTDDFSLKNETGGSLPVFLLADRGDCYLVLKAWNAQNAGAAAILIADDIQEPLLPMEFPATQIKNITIPIIFITKSLGDSIKMALNNINHHHVVNINLDWTEELLLLHPHA